mgnify:CR=1 FL=1
MFYPIFKCKQCGDVEVDTAQELDSVYFYEKMKIADFHKIHSCTGNDYVATLGVMEVIGFHEKK